MASLAQRRQEAETWRNLDKDSRLFEGTSSDDGLKATFESGEKTGDYGFLDNDIGGGYNAAGRTVRPAATIPSWEVTRGL
jgi:hypothetical protein